MKANLIVLKTQESQEEIYSVIEPTLTKFLAQNGVDITKSIYFKQFDELNKSLFGLLESCSILLVDMSMENIDFLFTQIEKFYSAKMSSFEHGKYWKDAQSNRCCLMFNINNLDFIKDIDKNFLKQLFAPTKFLNIVKTYGLAESEVRRVLRAIPNENNFEWYVTASFFDCEIDILAEAEYYNTKAHSEYIRLIYETLGDYIYSDTDDSLFQKLEELLSVRKTKIAICDTLTGGLFNNLVRKNLVGWNQYICAFYNINREDDLVNILKINENYLAEHGADSVDTMYEMAAQLLENTPASIVLVLTGTPQKPYIALGDKEAIHLYKFNFNHNNTFIYNMMCQTAIFKLLKKLKKNDILF